MEDHSPPEMRTKLRNILGAFLFSGEDAEKKVSVLSGGERARLALACLLLNPFNLLVLDEPTNHLDILSKDVLKNALMKYDGTIIVVSHDRHFLSELTSRTVEFRDKKLYEYLGDVNYFLEKREVEDMRAVELSSPSKSSATKSRKENLADPNQIKSLSNKIKKSESTISNLETDMKTLETKMGVAGFYESDESKDVLDKYEKLKSDLAKTYQTWEDLQVSLEELTS